MVEDRSRVKVGLGWRGRRGRDLSSGGHRGSRDSI